MDALLWRSIGRVAVALGSVRSGLTCCDFARIRSACVLALFCLPVASTVLANFEPVRFELEIAKDLAAPIDVATAPDGSVLVLDAKSLSVIRYTETGDIVATFGGKSLLKKPVAIATAPSGHIAIADQRAKQVLILDSSGNAVTRIGGNGTGAGQFSKVVDVAFDHFGFLYTSDAGSKRIARFTIQGVLLTEISFPDIVPDALSLDLSGHVNLLVNGGAEVYRFRPEEPLSRLQRITFDQAPTGAGGLYVDNYGDLYITRTGKNNVQKFDGAGTLKAAFGSRGKSRGAFTGPTRVAGNGSGQVYIVDSRNKRIQRFAVDTTSGRPLKKLTQSGPSVDLAGVEPVRGTIDDLGFVGVDQQYRLFGAAGRVLVKGLESSVFGSAGKKAGQFKAPKGIAALPEDRFVVADTGNNRIQVVEGDGSAFVVGERGKDPGFFNLPSDVAVNNKGMIYVADTRNGRVQIFTDQGIYVHSFGTTGKKPKEGMAPLQQFVNPTAIAIDSQDEVHVLDSGLARVVTFDSRGTPLRHVDSLSAAVDIAVDAQRNLYVAANGCHCVRVFDTDSKEILRFGGAGAGGGQLANITSIAVTGSSVLVADAAGSGSDLASTLLGIAGGQNKTGSSGALKTFELMLAGLESEDRMIAEHSFFVDAATRESPEQFARHRSAALESLAQKLAAEAGMTYAQVKSGMRIDSESTHSDGSILLRGSITAPEGIAVPEPAIPAPEADPEESEGDEVELAF